MRLGGQCLGRFWERDRLLWLGWRCSFQRRRGRYIAGRSDVVGPGVVEGVEDRREGVGTEDVQPSHGRAGRIVLVSGGAVGVDVPGASMRPGPEQDRGKSQALSYGEDGLYPDGRSAAR